MTNRPESLSEAFELIAKWLDLYEHTILKLGGDSIPNDLRAILDDDTVQDDLRAMAVLVERYPEIEAQDMWSEVLDRG